MVDLKNLEGLKTHLNTYLKQGFWMFKKGQKLADFQRGLKFHEIKSIKELAFGLNNITYNVTIDFKRSRRRHIEKDFILRVNPDNNNRVKIDKEAVKLKELQKIDIPSAKLFFYEDKLEAIGFRFLLIEKLEGIPALESINDFNPDQTKEFLTDLATFLGNLHSQRSKKYSSYYMDKTLTRKTKFPEFIMGEVKSILKGFEDLGLAKHHKVDTQYLYKWFNGHSPMLNLPGYSLIHGDVRASNIIVKDFKMVGFIDWEMSCYSDPAQDLGWTLFFFKLYENLKKNRGYFFTEYWKKLEKYDFEARVFFYEFLAAIRIYTYAQSVKKNNPVKYAHNKDFFIRVNRNFPNYIKTVTHR